MLFNHIFKVLLSIFSLASKSLAGISPTQSVAQRDIWFPLALVTTISIIYALSETPSIAH